VSIEKVCPPLPEESEKAYQAFCDAAFTGLNLRSLPQEYIIGVRCKALISDLPTKVLLKMQLLIFEAPAFATWRIPTGGFPLLLSGS